MKVILLTVLLCTGALSYAQKYAYDFFVDNVDTPELAKGVILHVRDLLGAKTIHFDDATDQFELITPHDFDLEAFKSKLRANGVPVLDDVQKTNVE